MELTTQQDTREHLVGTLVGWCVLIAGITQIPVMVAGAFTLHLLPRVGALLLLLSIPSGLLLIAGGVGLFLRKFFGYYCVYLAIFFGGIGGLKVPFIPFLKRAINFGPATEDLFLAINLVLVAFLLYEHWTRLKELALPGQRAHRIALIALVLLGLASVCFGRAMIHRERGAKETASALPIVGASFSHFESSGRIDYVSVETRLPPGITQVFSGNTTKQAVQALAEEHRLTRMDQPEAHKKFLPQLKAWKLNEAVFPSKFTADDQYYVGRLKDLPKVSLQIVYRCADGRFTAQIFGVLPPERAPQLNRD